MRKQRWFDSASSFALRATQLCSIEGDEGGSLSIDAAVGLLGNEAAEEQQQADSPGGDSTPAEATGADTPTGGESDQQPEAETPIDAPRSWNAEAKAKFAELPRDVQEIITAREGEREGALTKAQQEAADTRKKAEAEMSTVGQFKQALDRILPQAEEMFQHRWSKVDWVKLTEQLGAEEATKLKFQYDNEVAQLQRLKTAQHVASEMSFQKYVQAEGERLKTLAPELVDPKDGANKRAEVGKFLVDAGVDPQALRGISAAQLSIAYDAMRYRAAQKTLGKPAVPAKAVAKPAARASAVPQKQRVAALYDKANKSGRVEDMVAAMNAEAGQ